MMMLESTVVALAELEKVWLKAVLVAEDWIVNRSNITLSKSMISLKVSIRLALSRSRVNASKLGGLESGTTDVAIIAADGSVATMRFPKASLANDDVTVRKVSAGLVAKLMSALSVFRSSLLSWNMICTPFPDTALPPVSWRI